MNDKDEVVDRLIAEIRQKDSLIHEIKLALYDANCDMEKLTLAGGIRRLVLDLKNQANEIIELKKKLAKEEK